MEKAEFDSVADEYLLQHTRSIAASGESPEFFARYKIEDVAREASRAGVRARTILDFGAGIGNSLPHFCELFPEARVTCADVSTRSLDIARSRFDTLPACYAEITGTQLPFDNASFDICFSACVFHHIARAEHAGWLAELHRVTRPDGMLVIFEHNPLNPLTVAAVRNCPFDENAVLIGSGAFKRALREAGWRSPRAIYRLFFPRALSFARPVERWLRGVPLGAQYFVLARRAA